MGVKEQNKKNIKPLRIKSFFKDAKGELSRVSWPTRELVIRASGIILLIVVSLTLLVGIFDTGFSKLLFLLRQL